MATLRLTIDTDNAAFADLPGAEVARILREFAERVEWQADLRDLDGDPLRDINGNLVGKFEILGE